MLFVVFVVVDVDPEETKRAPQSRLIDRSESEERPTNDGDGGGDGNGDGDDRIDQSIRSLVSC